MPGPVSDSYDPEWGTADRASMIQNALLEMHARLGNIIGSSPLPISQVVLGLGDLSGNLIEATLTEREWRILRFACERAAECI